jgi:hypothetical protein
MWISKNKERLMSCYIGMLLLSLLGCQNTVAGDLPLANATTTTPAPPSITRPKAPSDDYYLIGDYHKHYPSDASIEDKMEYQLRFFGHSYRDLLNPILNEKPKFRHMVSACLSSHFPMSVDETIKHLRPEFNKPILLEAGVYLIPLLCSRGNRMTSSYALFIYVDRQGIIPNALKHPVGSVDKSGKLHLKETTEIFISFGGLSYDLTKKELQINRRWHSTEGPGSRAVYKYKNRRLHLAEYWQSDLTNADHRKAPALKQYYP